MKRIILLFGIIFSLVAVNVHAGETPTNAQKAHEQAIGIQKAVSLNPEQMAKVEVVLLNKLDAYDAIINDQNTNGAAKTEAIEALKVAKDKEFSEIMSTEQYNLFIAKREEAKARKAASH
ncbi:hypothetical protein BH11BAC7_BH11BAC7_13980 [soil metagenome]